MRSSSVNIAGRRNGIIKYFLPSIMQEKINRIREIDILEEIRYIINDLRIRVRRN
jgi:hypothetical protein